MLGCAIGDSLQQRTPPRVLCLTWLLLAPWGKCRHQFCLWGILVHVGKRPGEEGISKVCKYTKHALPESASSLLAQSSATLTMSAAWLIPALL